MIAIFAGYTDILSGYPNTPDIICAFFLSNGL